MDATDDTFLPHFATSTVGCLETVLLYIYTKTPLTPNGRHNALKSANRSLSRSALVRRLVLGVPVRFDGLQALPLLSAPHADEAVLCSAQQVRRAVKLQTGDGSWDTHTHTHTHTHTLLANCLSGYASSYNPRRHMHIDRCVWPTI